MSIWHDKSHHKVYHERILGLLSMYGQGLAPFDIGLADSCSAEDGWRFFYSVMWAPLDVLEDRWQSGTVKFEEWREISERARQGEPLWSVGDHFDLAGCYHRWILGLYWEPTPPHLDLGTRLWSAKKEDWPISLWTTSEWLSIKIKNLIYIQTHGRYQMMVMSGFGITEQRQSGILAINKKYIHAGMKTLT